jgi:hypothetical protein
LPQYLLGYIKVKPQNPAVKIIQVIYWIVGITVALDKFGVFDISEMIGKLQKAYFPAQGSDNQ